MASIKSILAAVDSVTVVDRHVTTKHHHGVKIAGWFRSSGFDVIETTDLVLVSRLGRVKTTVTITTTHIYNYDAEGNVVDTTAAKPVWKLQCPHEEVTVKELQRIVRSLGCQFLD